MFEPVCGAVKNHGYSYWPHQIPHWWMSLAPADQGSWVAGLGALAAAVVALYISQREQRRRAEEAHMKQRVVAAYYFTPISHLLRDVAHLRSRLIAFSDGSLGFVSDEKVASFRVTIGEMMQVVDNIKLGEIIHLPPSIAESVGFALGGYAFCLKDIDSTLNAFWGDARCLDNLKLELRMKAPRLDRPLDFSIDFITWFQKEFKLEKDDEISSLIQSAKCEMKVQD